MVRIGLLRTLGEQNGDLKDLLILLRTYLNRCEEIDSVVTAR